MRLARLLRPREVAEALAISRATAYRRIADGTIPSVRIGASVRVDPEELAEALAGMPEPRYSLGLVAAKCGRPLEWAQARVHELPTVPGPNGRQVLQSDLRVWLRAAESPLELRAGDAA